MKTIKHIIELLTVVAAVGSGWMKGIAPPEDNGQAVAFGAALVASLLAALIITAIARYSRRDLKSTSYPAPNHAPRWIVAAIILSLVAAATFYAYMLLVSSNTVPDKSNTLHVIGTLTKDNQKKLDSAPYNGDLIYFVRDHGGVNEMRSLCEPASIERTKRQMQMTYCFFMLLVMSAVFCLTEGALFDSNEDKATGTKGRSSSRATHKQATVPPK